MKRFLLFTFILLTFLSCQKTKLSVEKIDSLVLLTENKIKNNELVKKNIEGLNSFANQGECYYENNKLVKICALEGSPYGLNYFNFYLLNEKLVYTDIQFSELKKEYWDTMDTVKMNKENSTYEYEKTYFIDDETHLTKKDSTEIQKLNKNREKVILNQFAELIELIKKQ